MRHRHRRRICVEDAAISPVARQRRRGARDEAPRTSPCRCARIFPRRNRRRNSSPSACAIARGCGTAKSFGPAPASRSSARYGSNTKPLPLPVFGSKFAYGVAQSAGRARNRRVSILHRVHLGQPARLESRGHQKRIAAGLNLVCEDVVEFAQSCGTCPDSGAARRESMPQMTRRHRRASRFANPAA